MINEFQGEYRWLSNFVECDIEYNGFIYPSVENAYQAAKMKNKEDALKFLNVTSGRAKQLSKTLPIRDDWGKLKIYYMREFLIQKFSQKPYKDLLMNTCGLDIIEGNRWGDKYWGVCLKTNNGQNNLGKLIMGIRDINVIMEDTLDID